MTTDNRPTMTTISKEKVNYVRSCSINVDVFPDILRHILQSDIPPSQIYSQAQAKSAADRAARVRNPFILSREQWTLLHNAATAGYGDFDLTLLYTLIRNLTLPSCVPPSRGWGLEPSLPTQVTIGDDVERMRALRNKVYGHATSTAIPDNVFQGYWTTSANICSRMDTHYGGSKYIDMLNDIEKIEFVHKKVSDYIDIVTQQIQNDEQLKREVDALQIEMGSLKGTHLFHCSQNFSWFFFCVLFFLVCLFSKRGVFIHIYFIFEMQIFK